MHRFFVDGKQIHENIIEIVGKDVKHIKDVLRLKPSDIIEISSGGWVYICEILEIKPDLVVGKVVESFKGKSEPPIHITLYQGIAKGDKMDYIIQKATEIGVREIYPLTTNRTVVKIKNKKKEKSKIDRWNTIAEEAAKQSKRDYVPRVQRIINFEEMLKLLKGNQNIIVPYEIEESFSLKDSLNKIKSGKVHLIIGPEGGFEKEEIDLLKSIGGQSITLGPRILRTETAGLVAASIILYELGDLGVMK
ncbi:16S rRNA (uracil(1498)-N(3))-methyltransferase [Clostridium sp. Cult3]|uniref:16S rRNA (uracil(1498)-N(3))-methyltransferase n=1 Tax=Clostridium sp. Cult3 TaxID=2079004 RepID=UPI001F026686|nr:16S rRNA (uracil(1498)-N(3))-methyltransferase [Clostridium sp. Cult3]MCF6461086.1 16S rRNA (uracil(1498)-N(3))-methyltransferase [Clostridium sp. Cult3]